MFPPSVGRQGLRRPSEDYTRPITFLPTQKTPRSPIKRRRGHRVAPELHPTHQGRRVGQLGKRPHHLVELRRLDHLAPRHPRQLFQHLRPRRSARLLGRRRPARRTTPRASRRSPCRRAAPGGCPPPRREMAGELAPLVARRSQPHQLRLARGRRDPRRDLAAVERLARSAPSRWRAGPASGSACGWSGT